MTQQYLRCSSFVLFLLAAIAPATAFGQNDLDDHWLAAACAQVPASNGRLVGKVVERDYGVAVRPNSRKTVVLYCNVDADIYHNQIQLVAEDNSPNAHVTATLFQQDIFTPGAPPTAVVSVTTTDQPGLQVAKVFFDPALEPDEFFYLYFVKIEVVRSKSDPVYVYSVSMQDTL
jgi:hypothetical protein